MSVGEVIQCHDLDEAIKLHEQLCRDGWDVEFEYQKGRAVVLLLKGRAESENV